MPIQKLKQPPEMEKSVLNHSIVDKFSGTFRISEEAEQNG